MKAMKNFFQFSFIKMYIEQYFCSLVIKPNKVNGNSICVCVDVLQFLLLRENVSICFSWFLLMLAMTLMWVDPFRYRFFCFRHFICWYRQQNENGCRFIGSSCSIFACYTVFWNKLAARVNSISSQKLLQLTRKKTSE